MEKSKSTSQQVQSEYMVRSELLTLASANDQLIELTGRLKVAIMSGNVQKSLHVELVERLSNLKKEIEK
jgi:hypothetical protein